jgi:lipopolysaccharide export system protein LptA
MNRLPILRVLLLTALMGSSAVAFLFAADRTLESDAKISSKRPVEIDSNELTFERETGRTIFKGDVKVKHRPTTLEADEVNAVSGNRQAVAEGKVVVVDSGMSATLTCGHLEYKDQMRYITAHDNPHLTSVDNEGQPVTLDSRQMEFFSDQRMAIANQNVKVTHSQGEAQAGRATYLKDEGRLVLEEEPKVEHALGSITGRRITAYLDQDRIVAEGNVQAFFYPTPQDAAKKKAPTSPSKMGGPRATSAGDAMQGTTPTVSPLPESSTP